MRKLKAALKGQKPQSSPPFVPAASASASAPAPSPGIILRTDPSSPALAPAPTLGFPDGIKVWHDCVDATIDVCFVHGFAGNRDTTWTATGHPAPWPQTLLPQKMDRARIMTFGYDAYAIHRSQVSANRLLDHATNLLNDLAGERAAGAASRPVLFVAHSLGGLVCKETILLSRNHPEAHLRRLFDCVRGIVFLGTPHRGSWMADWARLPAAALGVVKSTNTSLLRVLQTDDQFLESIQNRFLEMVRGLENGNRSIKCTCFVEELPLPTVGKVVSKESATFPGYTSLSIHANHRDMARFVSVDDTGFKRITWELLRWRDEAMTAGPSHQQPSTSSWQLQPPIQQPSIEGYPTAESLPSLQGLASEPSLVHATQGSPDPQDAQRAQPGNVPPTIVSAPDLTQATGISSFVDLPSSSPTSEVDQILQVQSSSTSLTAPSPAASPPAVLGSNSIGSLRVEGQNNLGMMRIDGKGNVGQVQGSIFHFYGVQDLTKHMSGMQLPTETDPAGTAPSPEELSLIQRLSTVSCVFCDVCKQGIVYYADAFLCMKCNTTICQTCHCDRCHAPRAFLDNVYGCRTCKSTHSAVQFLCEACFTSENEDNMRHKLEHSFAKCRMQYGPNLPDNHVKPYYCESCEQWLSEGEQLPHTHADAPDVNLASYNQGLVSRQPDYLCMVSPYQKDFYRLYNYRTCDKAKYVQELTQYPDPPRQLQRLIKCKQCLAALAFRKTATICLRSGCKLWIYCASCTDAERIDHRHVGSMYKVVIRKSTQNPLQDASGRHLNFTCFQCKKVLGPLNFSGLCCGVCKKLSLCMGCINAINAGGPPELPERLQHTIGQAVCKSDQWSLFFRY
ncbi:Protein SERAC1 [Pleurostoma richardsiae]|uniref:Protein SERAC1 n=1 Tax=Pleurostoma richardsiae TaxID=41990 RepID=A0AA38RXB3_9PEZI|nr:Protein SERAC1 [Pleurostoma richardsiae]